MTSRAFPLGVVLTAIHDRHVTDFDEYRDFLEYMTGTDVALWNVGPARRAIVDTLRRQHPKLFAHRPPEKTDSGNSSRYIKDVAKKIGTDMVVVNRLRRGTFDAVSLSEALR